MKQACRRRGRRQYLFSHTIVEPRPQAIFHGVCRPHIPGSAPLNSQHAVQSAVVGYIGSLTGPRRDRAITRRHQHQLAGPGQLAVIKVPAQQLFQHSSLRVGQVTSDLKEKNMIAAKRVHW